MPRGNFVGVEAAPLDAQVRDTITAPGGNNRVVRRRRPARCISAGVDNKIDVQRRDRSIGLDTDLGLEYFRMARVLPKAVFRGGHQPHRPA